MSPRHIRVSGSAPERGYQYGKKASDLIEKSLRTYRKMFEICDISWQDATDKSSLCFDTVQRQFPMLLQELEGIADGSRQDMASIFTLNCRTEILPPDYLLRVTNLPAEQLHDNGHISECTSVATAQNTNPVWLAQTWDWVGLQRQAMVVLESHPNDGPSHITVTEAGMPAKIGLNEYGFGITLNILRSTHDGVSPGIPVHLFLRALLDCRDVKDAVALTNTLSFTGSSNIMIADKNGHLTSIEASPKAVRFIEPANNTLCHTNHFLDEGLAGQDAGLTGNPSTESRLERAKKSIATLQTLNDVHALLGNTDDGSESIYRYPDSSLPIEAQIETVMGVAMDLTDNTLSVTAAQPAEHAFQTYALRH